MIQGTYLQIPQSGDRGSLFCPSISQSISVLDIHTHDGITSAKVNAKSLVKGVVSLSSGSWIDTGDDYRQLVSLPSGHDFDTSTITAQITSGTYAGHSFLPTIIKVSPTTFYLHCIFGNVDVKVVIS
jgi:hypothetical protein